MERIDEQLQELTYSRIEVVTVIDKLITARLSAIHFQESNHCQNIDKIIVRILIHMQHVFFLCQHTKAPYFYTEFHSQHNSLFK